MKIEYFLFDFFILFFSTIGCLLYKGARWPNFFAALSSILPVGILFLIWDHLVTGWWWRFNDNYITGLKIGRLPIEEVLFFLIIPWSCLIIWENLESRFDGVIDMNVERIVILIGVIVGLIGLSREWWYTASVGLALILVVIMSELLGNWLRKKACWIFMSCVVVLTTIFNGYLTARPIVIYESLTMSGLRLGTVPFEDIVYGLVLMSAIVVLYRKAKQRLV